MYDSDELIILEDVPIITPNKDVVVSKLSFKVSLVIKRAELVIKS